jgi:hypothetical protein
MIDEKTNGTRGPPDSEVNALGGYVDVGEKEQEGDTFSINADDTFGITPLTKDGVSTLARLKSNTDKPFFKPTVQVIHLKKKPSSELYEVSLSDGVSYIKGTCDELVSKLAEEKYFTLFTYIKVQAFAITTSVDGARSCQLLCVENPMIPNPGEKIGNPVDISLSSAPGVPNFPFLSLQSPFILPSIAFGQSLRGMKGPSLAKKGAGGGSGDEFSNIMYMMMMQQQSDREQRIAVREH